MKIFQIVIISSLNLIFLTCGNKMPLPTVESPAESFGANDTSYIHVMPIWDATAIGYSSENPMKPVDIALGEDGYLFIADSSNDKIITLTQSGFLVNSGNLNTITPIQHPSGIDINAKLNLLIVNGTNIVYVWNQYINSMTIDSVAVFNAGDSLHSFSSSSTVIDSVLSVHPFYIDANVRSSFHDIAFGPQQDNTVFITDKGNNRILELQLEQSGMVKFKNGITHPTFRGVYSKDIATYGSGAGTVDNPRGLIVDDDGNIYFAQLGGNFFVQKLKKLATTYISGYTLYEDPIMDLQRFRGPYNLALDNSNDLFILDTEAGKVYKFYNKGAKAGRESSMGKQGLVDAVFNRAQGIVISESGMIYIAETGSNKIERYQFSTSESDLPIIQPF